jgi:hypothetical protein
MLILPNDSASSSIVADLVPGSRPLLVDIATLVTWIEKGLLLVELNFCLQKMDELLDPSFFYQRVLF